MVEICGFCGLMDVPQQVESGLSGLLEKQPQPLSGAFESQPGFGSLFPFPFAPLWLFAPMHVSGL